MFFSCLDTFDFMHIFSFKLIFTGEKRIKKRYVLLSVKCFEHIFEPSPNELAEGGRGHSRTMHNEFTQCIWSVLRYVYTLRLVGSISYLGGCYRCTRNTCTQQPLARLPNLFSLMLRLHTALNRADFVSW